MEGGRSVICDCGRLLIWDQGRYVCIGCGHSPWRCICASKERGPIDERRISPSIMGSGSESGAGSESSGGSRGEENRRLRRFHRALESPEGDVNGDVDNLEGLRAAQAVQGTKERDLGVD